MKEAAASFGATLRLLRIDAGVSLRTLAQKIGVSTTYLSRVENGHDAVPTPERLRAIARELDVSPMLLVELAHQVGPFLSEYLARVPTAAALFLDIARRDFDAEQLGEIRSFIDRAMPEPGVVAERFALSEALAPERIVIGLSCSAYDDVIDVAAARLVPLGSVRRAREVADAIRAREDEGRTFLGSGVAVPHAVVVGVRPTAVLLTLAAPLNEETPDGVPLSVVVVLVSGSEGHAHLERLAHVARIALHDFAGRLRACRTPRQVLERLSAFERTQVAAARVRPRRAGSTVERS